MVWRRVFPQIETELANTVMPFYYVWEPDSQSFGVTREILSKVYMKRGFSKICATRLWIKKKYWALTLLSALSVSRFRCFCSCFPLSKGTIRITSTAWTLFILISGQCLNSTHRSKTMLYDFAASLDWSEIKKKLLYNWGCHVTVRTLWDQLF